MYSTCIQNLATFASAVKEIWLQTFKLKMGHVTTPLLGVVVIQKLWFDIAYLYANFDDSTFSLFRYITGAPKFKVGHMTLTMSL